MKLIIDITGLMWERLKKHSLNWGDIEDIKDSIREGTPLDKLRAEISDFEEEVFQRPNTDYSDYAAVRHCLEIIDRYRNEVNE